MAEFPAFPLWTDAYLSDTGELTTIEHGAYLLLLIAMWRAGGSLPNDQHRLMRFARCSQPNQWAKIWSGIEGFFHTSGGTITQGRLGDELDKARSRSKKAAESARAKYRKTLKSPTANASSEHSSAPATITTSTSITKEEKKEPSLRSGTKARGTRLSDDWVLPKTFGDYALEKGLPRERILIEAQKMKDWSINSPKLGIKVDWFAAWRTWVQKALDDLPRLPSHTAIGPKPNSLQAAIERRRELRDANSETGSLTGASVLLLRDNSGR